MKNKYTVTFVPVGSPDRDDTQSCTVVADGDAEARSRAVGELYGPRTQWEPNHELGANYGQVSRSIRGASHRTCITGRMRIDIEASA